MTRSTSYRSCLRAKPPFLTRVLTAALVAVLQEVPCDAGGRSGDPPVKRGRAIDRLRIPFVPNAGQLDPHVAFSTTTPAGSVSVTHDGQIMYALGASRRRVSRSGAPQDGLKAGDLLTEKFLGGSPDLRAGTRTGTEVSYFVSPDPKRWRAGLPTYHSVHLGEVWPGVEVSLHSRADAVEKLFTLAPGASQRQIRVQVVGAERLRPGPGGSLLAVMQFGDVELTAPVAYQERDGKRLAVSVAYHLQGSEYGFRLGAYDNTLPVVIDPLLQSTYLGGPSDAVIFDIAIHPSTGDVYVAGGTGTGFPGTAGGAQPTGNGAFVARLNSALTRLIQATFVGGTGYQEAHALAVAPTTGEILVAGFTNSTDFPATAGAAQPALGGGTDAFVARLNPTLTGLLQATYFGGTRTEDRIAMALHPVTGDVLLTGLTFSTDLPGIAGGAQPIHAGGGEDAFVARLNPALTILQRATYAGGSASDGGEAVVVHPSSNEIFVSGFTDSTDFPGTAGGAFPAQPNSGSFVARFASDLTVLPQATYLGGSGVDGATDLAIHPPSGDILVVGVTTSPDFPGTAGGAQPAIRSGDFDAFAARFTSSLRTLIQATYLGGSQTEATFNVAVFPGGADLMVAGSTGSLDFPGTAGGAQASFAGGSSDAFVARLTSGLTRMSQATYLGGSGTEGPRTAAVHPVTGEVYVAGFTGSFDFPRTSGGAQETRRTVFNDAFVARLTGDLSGTAGPTAAIPVLSGRALVILGILLASAGVLLLKRAG